MPFADVTHLYCWSFVYARVYHVMAFLFYIIIIINVLLLLYCCIINVTVHMSMLLLSQMRVTHVYSSCAATG